MKVQRASVWFLVISASAALIVGCGGRGSGTGDPFYGPGTTGVTPPTGGSGSTTGGSSGGGSGKIGAFTAAPPLSFARQNHTATLFPKTGNYAQGGILVVGGDDGNGGIIADSEVFDPTKNAWAKTSTLNATIGIQKNTKKAGATVGRENHVAVALISGRVMVTGGFGDEGAGSPVLKTTFLFDPATNGFTQVDDCPVARFWHQGVLLGNGKVLVCTGFDQNGVTSHSADLFDGTSKWTSVSGAPGTAGNPGQSVLDSHWGAVLVGQGNKALVVSGANVRINRGRLVLDTPPFPANRVEVYDVGTDKFSAGPALNEDRVFFAGLTSVQGDSFLAGGLTLGATGGNTILDTINRFDHTAQKFVPTGGMNTAREFCIAKEVNGGKTGNFVVTGGMDTAGKVLDTAEVWQFTINGVKKPDGQIKMKKERVFHAAAPLLDGTMLVIGGADQNGVPMKLCDLYKD